MVHLKRTTHSTSRSGAVTYHTLIPRVPYQQAPQELRRAFRYELIDDAFPNADRVPGMAYTGSEARRVNDGLDAESDQEHQRAEMRDRGRRIYVSRRCEGGGEDRADEEEGEEKEHNSSAIQYEAEQQLHRESGVGALPEQITYDETNTPQFIERMRQHMSPPPPPPMIGIFASNTALGQGHPPLGSLHSALGARSRGGRGGRGRGRGRSVSSTPCYPPMWARQESTASGEYAAGEQNSAEFLDMVARHSSTSPSAEFTETPGREMGRGGRGGRGRARSIASPSGAEVGSVPKGRTRGGRRTGQRGRERSRSPIEMPSSSRGGHGGLGRARGRGRGRVVESSPSPI